MAQFEVTYTVYKNRDHNEYDSSLHRVTTLVECYHPQQAQALIEAQYAGLAHVWAVIQVD